MRTETVLIVGGVALAVILLARRQGNQFPQRPGDSWVPPDQSTGPAGPVPPQPSWICELLKLPGCGGSTAEQSPWGGSSGVKMY